MDYMYSRTAKTKDNCFMQEVARVKSALHPCLVEHFKLSFIRQNYYDNTGVEENLD